jgi:hypothetical protein
MFQPFEQPHRDDRRTPRGGARGTPQGRSRPFLPAAREGLAEFEGPQVQGEWLVAPMLLLALASALRLASRGPDSSFAMCFALLLGVGVAWVAIRLCLPPPAPPQCPHCRRRALVRLDPLQAAGARCLHCGWRDEAADARLLGAPLAAPLHLRGAVHVARPALAPRHGASNSAASRRSGGRPPRGPSGRGRRLR